MKRQKRMADEDDNTLRRKVESGEWQIREMRPDGNCLFRAVADQVYGDADLCDRVREQTLDHEERARDVYSQFVVDESFDDYLARMRRGGQVADHPEIQAMAELFCRPIRVYAADSGSVSVFQVRKMGSFSSALWPRK